MNKWVKLVSVSFIVLIVLNSAIFIENVKIQLYFNIVLLIIAMTLIITDIKKMKHGFKKLNTTNKYILAISIGIAVIVTVVFTICYYGLN